MHAYNLRLLVEAQSAVYLVAVPKPHRLPRTVFIAPLFRGKNLRTDERRISRQVKTNARVETRHQEFVGAKLRHQRNSVRVFSARRTASVWLREPERHSGLPPAKIQLLHRLPRLLYASLEFALILQLSNFAAHRTDESEVARMP